MSFVDTLLERNKEFAASGFNPVLKLLPSRKTMILACVDPRVDPLDVLKLVPGEAAIIRNVGGRVNPALFETMAILRKVSLSRGQDVGEGWNLIVLHHTDCGIIGCYHDAPDLLAASMGVATEKLGDLAIDDPHRAVAIDIEALRRDERIAGGFEVSGLVYDVKTGTIEVVVPAAKLRS